uniref:C2H2-type domain-containing protein n=1 Tax=Eptatretus burgeri TaxID=7764 RepID=A0A8C4QY64_EPTBU
MVWHGKSDWSSLKCLASTCNLFRLPEVRRDFVIVKIGYLFIYAFILFCALIFTERSEEHITIPSTKADGSSDQERHSIQTSDISSCQGSMKSQSNEQLYRCSVCGKGFNESSQYHTHLKAHNSEYPYSCSICGKAFSMSHCRTHLRVHNDERLYKCTVCEKAFFLSASFRDHMRVHSGERPYECPTCGKTFIRSSNYYTAHAVTDIHKLSNPLHLQKAP